MCYFIQKILNFYFRLALLTTCDNGSYLLPSGRCKRCDAKTSCDPTNTSLCASGTPVEYIDNAVSCEDGRVVSCSISLKVSLNSKVCESCGQNAVCNGVLETQCSLVDFAENCENGLIFKCEMGKKIAADKQSCADCAMDMFCNGIVQSSCSINNMATCVDGLITKCRNYYFINELFSTCLSCSSDSVCDGISSTKCSAVRNAVQCTGGKVLQCKVGYLPAEQKCDTCATQPASVFCNGFSTVQCSSVFNIINCSEGHINYCRPGFRISDSENECSLCTAPSSYCNGQLMIQCGEFNSLTCESGLITQCIIGKIVSDTQIQCNDCKLSYFCDGISQYECSYIIGSIQCFGGVIAQCQDGLFINTSQLNKCQICVENMSCDGYNMYPCQFFLCSQGFPVSCQIGFLLVNKSCQNCQNLDSQKYCNGKDVIPCSNVDGALLCQNGLVDTCKLGLKLSIDKDKCLQCDTNFQCNGIVQISCLGLLCVSGNISQCNIGSIPLPSTKQECFECISGFCDGLLQSSCSIIPFAVTCHGVITQCIDSMFLSSNRSVCLECQTDFVCDGVIQVTCGSIGNAISCKNHKIEKCQIGFLIEGAICKLCRSNLLCDGISELPCPSQAICNSGVIEKCQKSQYISSVQCLDCEMDSLCDGVNSISCQFFNAQKCQNNIIMLCKQYFLLYEASCTTCPINSICDGSQYFHCEPSYKLVENSCLLSKNTTASWIIVLSIVIPLLAVFTISFVVGYYLRKRCIQRNAALDAELQLSFGSNDVLVSSFLTPLKAVRRKVNNNPIDDDNIELMVKLEEKISNASFAQKKGMNYTASNNVESNLNNQNSPFQSSQYDNVFEKVDALLSKGRKVTSKSIIKQRAKAIMASKEQKIDIWIKEGKLFSAKKQKLELLKHKRDFSQFQNKQIQIAKKVSTQDISTVI